MSSSLEFDKTAVPRLQAKIHPALRMGGIFRALRFPSVCVPFCHEIERNISLALEGALNNCEGPQLDIVLPCAKIALLTQRTSHITLRAVAL